MVSLYYSGGFNNRFGITSIGGEISSTEIPSGVLNNLWDNVNRVEVINGRTEYRCFFITNDDSVGYLKAKLMTLMVPSDTEISFAVNDPGVVPELLVTEDAAPAGLSFLKFDEWRNLEIPIGKLGVGDSVAIWLKRKVLVGSTLQRVISAVIGGDDDVLVIGEDFNSVENSFDNIKIDSRSTLYFTDIDSCGEALLN